MKKYKIKTIISSCIVLFLILMANGCKKDKPTIMFQKPKSFKTKQEAKKYIKKQLSIYAIVFADLSRNQEIKNTIYESVAEKFDGDDNVLIKTLINRCENKRINIKGIIESILQKKGLNLSVSELLNSLNDLNGKNLYLQIYIPNFDKYNKSSERSLIKNNLKYGKIASLNAKEKYNIVDPNPTPPPVIVPYDGDESVILSVPEIS